MKTQILAVVGAVGSIIIGVTINYLIRKRKQAPILLEDPSKKYKLPLIEKETISHDTRRYRFGLPTSQHVLGLPLGQHIKLSAEINGEVVSHSYTPVSSDDDHGFVDLVIKVYFKNVHPKFPEGGKLTQYIENMKLGEEIDVFGPVGRLFYRGYGNFAIKRSRTDPTLDFHTVNKVVMIAGGSGIAPMLQLIRAIMKDPSDSTKVSLLFANQSEKDILLREELEEVLENHPNKFQRWYTVDVGSDGWKFSTGYITAEMISAHMYPPAEDTIVLVCGPPAMIKNACTPNLDKLGYDNKLRYIY
ncbi:NADH-cytochrome b5 reductase 2-like [Microplitis mediator]|uniref:NADH-cytochrome b5 reductase 2-like n=1 Tax=Microplitis mediator TaxID=375433 RepID=UPI002553F189|nr:NADH-cytochrome b5 reductase 2-like [Microplitis mediator]